MNTISIRSGDVEFSNPPPNTLNVAQFFPSYGRLSRGGNYWQVAIRGRTVIPRPNNLRKTVMMRMLSRALDVTVSELESSLYFDRVDDFLMLGLRDRNISVRIDGRLYPLKKPSRTSGYFDSSIRVPIAELPPAEETPAFRQLRYSIGAPHSDHQEGSAQLIGPVGPSIISDIDDTLKHTDATDRTEMLKNTFLRHFEVIPGMAEQFQTWASRQTAFHYVSASPWPLFRPLHQFLVASGYPVGSYHLRKIRFQGTGPLRLLLGGKREKRKAVRSILKWFPHRQFVLIGDSEERDPEIYGWAARRFPKQVSQIWIRQIRPVSRKRLSTAFRDIRPEKWNLFEHAEELSCLSAVARVGWQRKNG